MLPFTIWREAFINDADLKLVQFGYSQLSPEPYQPFGQKLDLKKFYSLDIPKSYINATEDIALPQGEWGWHPRMSNRSRSNFFWGTFRCKGPNATLAANSGFDQPSMIALASSRILELGVELGRDCRPLANN